MLTDGRAALCSYTRERCVVHCISLELFCHASSGGLGMHVEVYFAQHIGCPFGAVASVHAWERVGAAVCHIARVYLKIPVRLIWSAFVSPLSERF